MNARHEAPLSDSGTCFTHRLQIMVDTPDLALTSGDRCRRQGVEAHDPGADRDGAARHAVLEVLVAGVSVTAVAERYGVSRQSVHTWPTPSHPESPSPGRGVPVP